MPGTRPKRGRGGSRPATSRADPSRVSSPLEAVCGFCSKSVVGDCAGAPPPAICGACSKAVADEETHEESPQAAAICGVCSKDVVDGEDDALLCEGPCACWLHRHCAVITLHCYDELAKSSFPFVC